MLNTVQDFLSAMLTNSISTVMLYQNIVSYGSVRLTLWFIPCRILPFWEHIIVCLDEFQIRAQASNPRWSPRFPTFNSPRDSEKIKFLSEKKIFLKTVEFERCTLNEPCACWIWASNSSGARFFFSVSQLGRYSLTFELLRSLESSEHVWRIMLHDQKGSLLHDPVCSMQHSISEGISPCCMTRRDCRCTTLFAPCNIAFLRAFPPVAWPEGTTVARPCLLHAT